MIVYNPRGGAALRDFRLAAALRELRAMPEPSVVIETDARDMAAPVRRALQQHPAITQVVACGGDGTVAACAAAAVDRNLPVAIIPTGTTNVLAFELGLPSHPVKAARMLSGPTRRVSFRTWSVNGHPMLLQLGIGFDGQLMWRTPRAVKRALGFLGVTASAFRTGITFDYPEVRLRGSLADGGTLDVVVTSAMVANAKRWAGPQIAVPAADPSDDVIDVLLVDYRNFGQLARFWLGILFPGSPHLRLPYVRHARMTRLQVEAVGRAVEAHVDGEPSVMTPITVEPLGRVDLLAPASRS